MDNKPIKLLFVEDQIFDQQQFQGMVLREKLNYNSIIASSISDAKTMLRYDTFDIIITNYMMGDGTAFDLFELAGDTPIILITEFGYEDVAVKALTYGAYDYVIKDYHAHYMKFIPLTVSNAMKRKETEEALHLIESERQEAQKQINSLKQKLLQAYEATLQGWSQALDLRDKETKGHSERVTEMALQLARAMEVEEEELIHIRRGALLHDIGKLGIPDGILLKPGSLTKEEWSVMRQHPVYAYEWLTSIEYLQPALDIPYCHHERWDGTGYPRGLKGEEIPLSARIFSVVDIWDALLSDRPYRPRWSKEQVRDYIRSLAGSHLDPKVVDVFFKLTH